MTAARETVHLALGERSYDILIGHGLIGEAGALLEPVLAAATAPYGYRRGDFPRVMFADMAPGGVIHPGVRLTRK